MQNYEFKKGSKNDAQQRFDSPPARKIGKLELIRTAASAMRIINDCKKYCFSVFLTIFIELQFLVQKGKLVLKKELNQS